MTSVIPAPFRVEARSGEFQLRSGVSVVYGRSTLAPLVERFCSEAERRTGLRFEPMIIDVKTEESTEPAFRIDIAEVDDLAVLPGTSGVSPVADVIPDERYALTIDANGIELIAREPVGIARGLTTLEQLLATATATGGAISLPGQGMLDVPRYAWRLSLDVARRFLTVEDVKRISISSPSINSMS